MYSRLGVCLFWVTVCHIWAHLTTGLGTPAARSLEVPKKEVQWFPYDCYLSEKSQLKHVTGPYEWLHVQYKCRPEVELGWLCLVTVPTECTLKKKKKKHSKELVFSFSGRPVLFQSCCLLPIVSVPFNSHNRKDESLGDVMVASMGFPPSSKLLLSLPDIGHTCSLALCCYIWAVIYSSAMEKQ